MRAVFATVLAIAGAGHHRDCEQTFTPEMGQRAALAIYRGTRRVSLRNLRLLGYIERCQRRPGDQARVRAFDRNLGRQHDARVNAARAASSSWRWPWSCIAKYESGGDPSTDTGNGYYGGLQFTLSTWAAYGGAGNPAAASIPAQEAVADRVLRAQGWGAWPISSRRCGL